MSISQPGKEKVRVRGLFLNVTTRCNMECRDCYGHLREFQPGDMDLSTARKATELFFRNRALSDDRGPNETIIMFWGGEPLLNLGLIREYLDFMEREYPARDGGYRFAVTTNGLLLDEELIRYFFGKSVEIFVSIDGPFAIHRLRRNHTEEQYRHVSGMVRFAARLRPDLLSTYTVLRKENLFQLGSILSALDDLQVRRMAVSKDFHEYFWPEGVRGDLHEDLLRFKEQHPETAIMPYPEMVGGCVDCRPMYMMVYPDQGVWDLCSVCAPSLLRDGQIGLEDLNTFRFGTLGELEHLYFDVEKKRALIRPNMFCPTLGRSCGEVLTRTAG